MRSVFLGVVMLKGVQILALLEERHDTRQQNFISVAQSGHGALENVQRSSVFTAEPTPDHHATTTKPISFHDVLIDVPVVRTVPHSSSAIRKGEVEFAFVGKQNT